MQIFMNESQSKKNNISNMISTARHKMKMKTLPSVDECKEAVFDMKNNKFSGLDGIPCKFYKYIWSLIGCYFMKYYYPFL